MKRGRLPKPTKLKLIQGNPGGRPLTENEVFPDVVIPGCPKHLAGEALNEWHRITPLLEKYDLLTEIDTAALALYCQAYGRWIEAEIKISEWTEKGGDQFLMKAPSGYPIKNPYLSAASQAMDDCYKYLQQFGLSPSARTRVTANERLGSKEKAKKKEDRFFG